MLCGVGLRASALKRMLEPELAARILHGSDVPVTGALLWAFGLIRWSEWRAAARTANPVERDAQIKRAPGLGEETFARLAQWLRRA